MADLRVSRTDLDRLNDVLEVVHDATEEDFERIRDGLLDALNASFNSRKTRDGGRSRVGTAAHDALIHAVARALNVRLR